MKAKLLAYTFRTLLCILILVLMLFTGCCDGKCRKAEDVWKDKFEKKGAQD
jgi:hypothetical protein